MHPVRKTTNTCYDYAIIGSGLTGLCVANALSKISNNVVLIEANESFGGHNRTIQSQIGPINNGIRFFPDGDLSRKAVAFLEVLLNSSLSPESVENPILTYEGGCLKPFVGFGDSPPAFYDEISYYTSNRQLKLILEPHEWTSVLFNNYCGEFLPRSYVTKIMIENKRATGVLINGQKTIHAHNIIYSGPVKELKQLLPTDAISQRAQQKLSKSTYWTAVCLDLFHNHEVTDSESMHILNGTTEDDLGPCAGIFHPTIEMNSQKIQSSQWISFVDNEEAEDSEKVGAALRKIKKQIKRAYPTALDGLKYERILVVPNHSGNGDLKVSGNGTVLGVENLWIASASMHKQKNVLGSLLQAEFICSSLSCHPMGNQIETAEPLFVLAQPNAPC